jgi:long-chain acyl-CoA synthetase
MITLDEMTVGEVCLHASAKYAGRPALGMFSSGKLGGCLSYSLMGIHARQIASVLGRLGLRTGDRVMLLSENRPEWPLAYFGIALAGAVSVPILTGFSADQISRIVGRTGVSAICVSRAQVVKIKENTPVVPLVFIDTINITAGGIAVSVDGVEKILPLDDPADAGCGGQTFPRGAADGPASIVYTSGTQGHSKGVMLSHRNLIYCARASRSLMPVCPRDRLLSVLPLAHTYECTLGLLAAVMGGASITYLDRPPSPSVLFPAAKALRPSCMVTVPLLIEKIYRNSIVPALKTSLLHRFSVTRPLALRLAGRKLKNALGGSLRFFGIGGAPLSPEVEDFLYHSRFPYAPGYGLTETAPLVAGTGPRRFPLRSAGSVLPGLELRITPESEIQVRGPNVMMGYYRDEEQTREAFTADGWLRTGDLGRTDNKGRLFIRGRLKSLILGPSGENICPEEIEGLLNSSNLVEDALVYPGEKGELVALVRLSENAGDTARVTVSALERGLEELRLWANKKLASFARLSRIEVRKEPFEKTPTQKIKRYLYGKNTPLYG